MSCLLLESYILIDLDFNWNKTFSKDKMRLKGFCLLFVVHMHVYVCVYNWSLGFYFHFGDIVIFHLFRKYRRPYMQLSSFHC